MSRPQALLVLAALLSLQGCPDSAKAPVDGPAQPTSASTGAPTTASPSQDPAGGGIFTREEVIELFRAEHAAGANPGPDAEQAKARLWKKHRLIDDEGREVTSRVRAYERAFQALAADERAWAEVVETLDR